MENTDIYFASSDDMEKVDDFDLALENLNFRLDALEVQPLVLENVSKKDAIEIVNSFSKLFNLFHTSQTQLSDASTENKKFLGELDVGNKRIALLENQLQDSEREAYQYRIRLEKAQEELSKANQILKETKAELIKTQAQALSKHNQFVHELRKKDKEFEKIQGMLNRNLGDKSTVSKLGIEVLNASSKPKPQKLPTTDQVEEISKRITRFYEERERQILEENNHIRSQLVDYLTKMKTVFNEEFQLEEENQPQILTEMIETSLTENLEEALNFFQEMKLYRGQMENGQEEKTTQLEQQLAELAEVIEKQENLLQMSLKLNPMTESSLDSSFSSVESKTHELEHQQKLLLEQKRNLEKERTDFTQAALELGKERAEIIKMKVLLEEEKRAFETQKFIATLCDSPIRANPKVRKVFSPITTPRENKMLKTSPMKTSILGEKPFFKLEKFSTEGL